MSRWNSPSMLRNRNMRNITAEAKSFDYVIPNKCIDNDLEQGQLIKNATLLLNDALEDSRSRDLSVVAKTWHDLGHGSLTTFNNVVNTKDYGIGEDDTYEKPKDWDLPCELNLLDQRTRLQKAAALILMELERLDRMNIIGRESGYGMFNPEHKEEKETSNTITKQLRKRVNKLQKLDIYEQAAYPTPTATSGCNINVAASSQSQFIGDVQPMPQAVPC